MLDGTIYAKLLPLAIVLALMSVSKRGGNDGKVPTGLHLDLISSHSARVFIESFSKMQTVVHTQPHNYFESCQPAPQIQDKSLHNRHQIVKAQDMSPD